MKTNLKAVTSVGDFTRATASTYTHVVVWNSPRAARSFAAHSTGCASGVAVRWFKDRGFGVTWHSSERAAQNATRAYKWDAQNATLVGVFPVTQ